MTKTKSLCVYFIRHAESNNNLMHLMYGDTYEPLRLPDPPLSPPGVDQAKSLNKFVKENWLDFKFEAVFASPMVRAIHTAQLVSEDLEVDKAVWSDVFEARGCRDKGKGHPGTPRHKLENMFPEFRLPSEVTDEGWYFNPKEETREEAFLRAKMVWNKLKWGNLPYKRIALVSHGMFLNCLFTALVKKDLHLRKIHLDSKLGFFNTGVTKVVLNQGSPVIDYIDRVDHLPEPPRHKGGSGNVE